MEIRFISKKPWVNADIKLKKALMITTTLMAMIGLICAIVGVILTVYQEYVVGIVSIIIGALIPVAYFLINIFMLAEQRKKFDKNLIVEYAFFEDHMEVISLSNNYKSKSVVNYSGLISLKTRMRYFFLRFETESFVIRKGDVKVASDKTRAINELLVYLNSKIRDNMLAKESTCATDEVTESAEDELEEITDNVSKTDLDVEESSVYEFENLDNETVDNVDVEDENNEIVENSEESEDSEDSDNIDSIDEEAELENSKDDLEESENEFVESDYYIENDAEENDFDATTDETNADSSEKDVDMIDDVNENNF